jgi:hypothetical protein
VMQKSPSERPTNQVQAKNVDVSSQKKNCLQPSILEYIQRDSLKKLPARCAANDGFSFRSITRSAAVQEFITKGG